MAPTSQSNQPTRQSKGGSLQQALASLTEEGQRVLWAAAGLERRLIGNLMPTPIEAPTAPVPLAGINEPPLLDCVEEQIRKVLGQIRETNDILAGIEQELS